MLRNVGTLDRAVRLLVALLLGFAVFAGLVQGALAWIAGLGAAILLVTALFGFCPLYRLLGIGSGTGNA